MEVKLHPLCGVATDAAHELYLLAFPPEERRQWEQIVAHDAPMQLLGVFDDDNQVGFITVWQLDGFAYVEHFAIDQSCRGKGVGAKAIDALIHLLNVPVVLEVEPRNHPDPMALRRIAFYERCGFTVLDYPYVQPPYGEGLPEVPLLLMTTDPTINAAVVTKKLHKHVYNKD